MSKLGITVPFHNDETVISYVSRLAVANFTSGLREFCIHMGLSARKLANGDEVEIAKLSSLVDIDERRLQLLCSKLGDRNFRVNGQLLSGTTYQRYKFRYCPKCLDDDIASGCGPSSTRPYARLAWNLTFIRSCILHDVMLVDATNAKSIWNFDFTSSVSRLEPDSKLVVDLKSTDFERYIIQRVHGNASSDALLDSLPLFAAGRICEWVGATILDGKSFITLGVDDATLSERGQAGFALLLGGENAFRLFLQSLHSDYWESGAFAGAPMIYGRMYELLSHEHTEVAYDPIRAIIRDDALNSFPVGEKDDFFGPLGERRLHSLSSAASEHGVDTRRLRKLLKATGAVTAEAAEHITDGRLLVPRDQVDRIVAKLKSRMTAPQAREYLKASLQLWHALHEEGYLSNAVGSIKGSSRLFYIQSDLDDFLDRMNGFLSVTSNQPKNLRPLHKIVKQAFTSYKEVLTLPLLRKA